MPAEILPLADRLNSLFADIVRTREKERNFTADAAHELRTPLAALKAQAQVAQASAQEDERQHALKKIIEGCDRATHLVAQLLTLARLDAKLEGNMEPLSLRALAEEVLAGCAGKAIETGCELELDEGDAKITGDPLLLRVLLRNLVDNALLHSGGKHVQVSIELRDASALLRVLDDGRGIPESDRKNVTQRFYRVRQINPVHRDLPDDNQHTANGTGLGLSIVARITELHRAELSIQAGADGYGTEVTVRFRPSSAPVP